MAANARVYRANQFSAFAGVGREALQIEKLFNASRREQIAPGVRTMNKASSFVVA
jgi:hypothetical protein